MISDIGKTKKIIFYLLLILFLSNYAFPSILPGAKDLKIAPALALKLQEYSQGGKIPVIITLKRSDSDLEGINIHIKKRYDLINAVSADISSEDLEELEKNQDVLKIFYDEISPLPITESQNAHLMGANMDTIGATYVNTVLNYTGKNVTIAIVDTGIDYTHPDLGGCIGISCKVLGGYDFVNLDADPMDDVSHGTHCAGIAAANGDIKGVAPDARLLAVKVCNSSCTDSNIIAGIDWAVANGANIISLSLGTNKQPSSGETPIQMLLDATTRRGVTVVAAAGNEGPGEGTLADIATSRSVIAVGGDKDQGTVSAADDTIPDFSSRGPAPYGRFKPEVLAPGYAIYSTIPGGGYGTKGGTSMSTPHVAGAAAVLLEYNRSLTPAQIKSLLIGSAEPITGHPFDAGAGLINLTRAITSNLYASINEKPIWEEVVFPGMNATASMRINNKNDYAISVSLNTQELSDIKQDNILPASSLIFPEVIQLGPLEEKTFQIIFKPEQDTPPGTYATILRINSSSDSIRIPFSLTVPLVGNGKIYSTTNHDCSAHTQDGCGPLPSSAGEWGDWRFYKLANYNGTRLRVNLTWPGIDNDLDLYLYGPDGGLYNYSGQGDTTEEHLILSNPAYQEYWAAVSSYKLSTSPLAFNLTVSYDSAIRLEPKTWQGILTKGGQYVLNYTLINDGISITNLQIDAVMQKNTANNAITGTVPYGSTTNNIIWKKSTSGLDLTGARYMNATLTWNTPSKDLDMDLVYHYGTWNDTGYWSNHRSDLLGIGQEEIIGADIKYFIETFSDLGILIYNPGSAQNYALKLNFSGEGACSYSQPNPSTISSMSAGTQRAIQVSINTSNLEGGITYDYELVVKKDGIEESRVPLRFTVVTTTTTTTSTTTSTTIATSSTTTSTSSTTSTSTSTSTSMTSTTAPQVTTTTTTTGSTTTSTEASCSLAGDYSPCGEVSLSEVVAYINEWVENEAALSDVIALINAWAQSQ